MKKQLAILAFLALQSATSFGQDAHYSQYFVAPLSINPALTGFMDGTARAMVNHRSQWASINNAFSTTTASLDGIILQSKIPTGDRLGVGMMAMSDKVADGLLTNNYFAVSTAYHKAFDKEGNYTLGIGLQGTYSQRSIDAQKLVFNDELDRYGSFTRTSSDPAKTNNGLRRNYWDVAVGGVFKGRINDKQQFYVGVSAYHLGQPKMTFLGNNQLTVPLRLSFNGAYEARLSDMVSLSLLGLYTQQENANEGVFGAIATFGRSYREFDKTPIFYAGVLYRTQDAIIPYLGLEYYDVRFGFSYDYNTSALSAATNGQGGIEASIVYLLRIPPNKKIQYLCPNNPKF
ncbi:MAG: PorP/SprF family type IX secretion system membrane protein [Chitinophagaceae bacterium]|nr:PorP/SprF family type IX secretion system membrane protein [Chitinophagaceae bacterium]